MAESSVEFRHGSLDNDHEAALGGLGKLHLLQDDTTDSIPTGDLPSTTVYDDESTDPTLVMGRPGHHPAPRLAFQEYSPQVARGRPGWQGHGGPPAKHPRTICYIFYGLGHMANNCLVSLRDTHTVVRNFDALSEEDKSRVPGDALHMARATLAGQQARKQVVSTPSSDFRPSSREPSMVPAPAFAAAERHPSILRRTPGSTAPLEPKN